MIGTCCLYKMKIGVSQKDPVNTHAESDGKISDVKVDINTNINTK